MVDLSVIIVSWNSRSDIERCLRSLRESGGRVAYEVIVVDNASADGTVSFLRGHHPEVRLMVNTENRGFAAANNQAFAAADARYLLLLNPDTIVHAGALDALVSFMDEHADAAAAGPLLQNVDGSVQYTGVRFPLLFHLLVETFFLDRLFPRSKLFGRHKEMYADPTIVRRVEYVQGSCMIVRADVVRSIGGLDEQFFMYFEEVDWCRRMRNAGHAVYIVPFSSITHLANAEVGHYDERRVVHYHRSLLLYFQKHHSLLQRAMLRVILVLRSVLRIVVWSALAIVRPVSRSKALSAIRGYVRTLRLLVASKEPLHG